MATHARLLHRRARRPRLLRRRRRWTAPVVAVVTRRAKVAIVAFARRLPQPRRHRRRLGTVRGAQQRWKHRERVTRSL